MISDTQIPFEHPKALAHCLAVQKFFKVGKANVIHCGDEIDQYFASRFPKDPDARMSPRGEIYEARERLKSWFRAFPFCRVAISNHGMRWLARANEAGIPSELIVPYKEILGAPRGWSWHDEIYINTKHPFRVIHGMGYSGVMGARNAAMDGRVSTAIGHLHSHAGISYVRSGSNNLIWGFNTGCLIAEEKFAFKYGKYTRFKAAIGCGVVLDHGKTPVWVPL